jgi:MoxR-like ATPase
MSVEERAEQFRDAFERLHAEIGKVIVGSGDVIDNVLTCLFAGGHCLLEGVPGLGKTMLVRTLSQTLDSSFSRIQFTPDLMPADILGTNLIVEDEEGHREMHFRHGPIFANIILADEINRATPKTQSAMLEAMQEHTVTVGTETYAMQEPFFVLATQNPIEMEGTYPLPEAQVDRFMFKIMVTSPSREVLSGILDRTTQRETPTVSPIIGGDAIVEWRGFVRDVVLAPPLADYISRLILATHPTSDYATENVRKYVRFGSSPRGGQALALAAKVAALRDGRFNVGFADLRGAAAPALRHRVLLNFEAEADDVSSDEIVAEILDHVSETESVAV